MSDSQFRLSTELRLQPPVQDLAVGLVQVFAFRISECFGPRTKDSEFIGNEVDAWG